MITFHASAAETATVTSAAFKTLNKEYVALFVNVSAITGTTPTMVVKIQESADGTNFSDVPSFTTASLTATGQVRIAAPSAAQKCSDWVRAVATIGGTTPSVTFTSYLCTTDIQPN